MRFGTQRRRYAAASRPRPVQAWAGRGRAFEREEGVDIGGGIPETPDAKRGDEDQKLDARRREVRDDRFDRLRPESEGGDRTLDQEEDGEPDPRLKTALAPAGHHDRDDGVEDREHVGDLGEVVVLAGKPRRAPRVHAVEESVDDEEDRREQHQEDDRTERPCHPRPPSLPRNLIPRCDLGVIPDVRWSPVARTRHRGWYRARPDHGSRCRRWARDRARAPD